MEINEYEKKQNNNNENKKQHHFQVKNTPNGFFDLFNKVSDTYIYEKKFCCDLPQNIIPPKSLHYPLCLENLCKTDLLTMNFDLKNYGEILTDPKLNTLIHEDFINNALEIVFPNLTKFSEKKTEKDVEFKNDILNIIERNDEILEEKPKILLEKPYYLRSSTFFRPSLSNFNDYEKKKSNKNINKENKKNEINIVKYIENSFKLIENIKEGFVHPKNNKKVVKKVYDILPMVDYLPFKINQYMFPNDPIKELELNKKIEIPKTFIIKKKNNSNNNNNEHNNNFYNNNENEYELEDFSLYKNEKAKDQILDENKNYATYYSHEKDYSLIKSHDYENFNRYLLFKDNIKNTIGVLLTNDKITLKRQNFSKNKNYDGNEDENMNFLNQKRERDLIIMPKNLEEETINKIKKYFKNIGMEYKLDIKNIDDIDFSQIEGVKNIKNEEEEEKNNLNNYDYNNNKENDLNEDYENNENDNNNSLDNENYNSENKIDDEIDEAHTPNANENEEEEDALFEDDGNNNNNDNNDNNENNNENENDDNNENKNEDEIEKKNKNIINDE